jgi:hypothetical protein
MVCDASQLAEEEFLRFLDLHIRVQPFDADGKRQALTREVAALRCGLDCAAWDRLGHCGELLSLPPEKLPNDDDPLPFDLRAPTHSIKRCSARWRSSSRARIC